ncbi:hypothetical protein [Kistimonas asteriae]|uniref:hypothetical protein n=1 Tax=Kistimonas asteriae TaxID=517724 RepID=UPI001BA8AABA|nr:hypothetical protein [Kistimonas asteriae]
MAVSGTTPIKRNQHSSACSITFEHAHIPKWNISTCQCTLIIYHSVKSPSRAISTRQVTQLGTAIWGEPDKSTAWDCNTTSYPKIPLLTPPRVSTEDMFSVLYDKIELDTASTDLEKHDAYIVYRRSLLRHPDKGIFLLSAEDVNIQGYGHFSQTLFLRAIQQYKCHLAQAVYDACPDNLKETMLKLQGAGGFNFLTMLLSYHGFRKDKLEIKLFIDRIKTIPDECFLDTSDNNNFLHFLKQLSSECITSIYRKCSNKSLFGQLIINRNRENHSPIFISIIDKDWRVFHTLFIYLLKHSRYIPSLHMLAAIKYTEHKRSFLVNPIKVSLIQTKLLNEANTVLAMLAKTPFEQNKLRLSRFWDKE